MIVARMQKMKAGNLTGSQKHSQREFKNHSNEDMDQEDLNLFFEIALVYFSSKFGSQNKAYAQVHLDETTPIYF